MVVLRLVYWRLAIVPVEIPHLVIEPEISMIHSVRIKHRNDLENKHLSQNISSFAISQQKLYEPFYEKGRVCLWGMHSGCKHDDRIIVHLMGSFFGKRKYFLADHRFFLSKGLYVAFGRDCYKFDFSSLVWICDSFLVIVFLTMNDRFLFFLSPIQKGDQIVIGVWLIYSKIAISPLVLFPSGCGLILLFFLEKQIVCRSYGLPYFAFLCLISKCTLKMAVL